MAVQIKLEFYYFNLKNVTKLAKLETSEKKILLQNLLKKCNNYKLQLAS